FNFIRDIEPVTAVVRLPNIMVVHPSVPAKSVPEFIAYAKANPGRINMAYSTSGGTDHLAGELFKNMAGGDNVRLPVRGGVLGVVPRFGRRAGAVQFPRHGQLDRLHQG